MNKSSFFRQSTLFYWLISILFATFFGVSLSSAQITKNPIPEPIEKSNLSVGFEEIVKIPDSGTEKNTSARLNLLLSPKDGSGRLFVNDMRGKLYIIINRKAT